MPTNKSNHDEQRDDIILALDVGSSGIRCLAYRLIYNSNVSTTAAEDTSDGGSQDWTLERVKNCSVICSKRVVEPSTGHILLFGPDNDEKDAGNQKSLLDEIDGCIDSILSSLRKTYGVEQIRTSSSSSDVEKAKCNIVAMGISTFAMNVIGIDENGELVGVNESMTYACNSSDVTEECKRMRSQLTEEEQRNLYKRTGAPLHSAFALPQLRSYYSKCSNTTKKVKYWQTLSSLCLSRWLSKTDQRHPMPISYSEASWMGLLNYRTCTWDEEAMKLLPSECVDALPPLADALDINVGCGGIPEFVDGEKEIAHSYWERWPELCGAEGNDGYCQFFLGVGDGACANIGSKCTTPSRIAVTVGTSAAARVCLPLPIVSTDNLAIVEEGGRDITPPPGLFCYRIDKSHVLVGGALTDGGSIVEWAREFLGLTSNESFSNCMEEVSCLYSNETEQGNSNNVTVVPFLSGERSTGYRDGATGCVMGLTRDTTRAQFFKSCLEGVILRINAILILLQEVAKNTIDESDEKNLKPSIVASGTALERNALWRQMLCDCSGLNIVMDDEVTDGTSRGAARLAASAIIGAKKSKSGESISEISWAVEKLVISERLIPAVRNEVKKAECGQPVSTSKKWTRAKESQDSFLDAISPLWR